jgi:hypothetical protein
VKTGHIAYRKFDGLDRCGREFAFRLIEFLTADAKIVEFDGVEFTCKFTYSGVAGRPDLLDDFTDTAPN